MTISGEDSLEDIKTKHTNFAYILKRMDKIKQKRKKTFGQLSSFHKDLSLLFS